MGIGAELGAKSATNGMRCRTTAAEARHLRVRDERSGSPAEAVDDLSRCRLVQRMSRRSRHARSALNQPDLFSFPQLMVRQDEAFVRHETKPRAIEQRPISETEPKKQLPPAAPIIRPERRPSREAPATPVHLLDVRAAAAWLGLSKSTLDKMRCYGVGPRFIRATGRAVRYDPADLAAFAEGRRQSRTSDEVPASLA